VFPSLNPKRVRRAKRPLACLFPEPVRQSAQAAALLKNNYRDVLISLFRRREWIVASLKPKLFCGVAFMGEVSFRASKRWSAYHLRHNNCQPTVKCVVEQRLHPDRTNWTLL
jgi:hypothetical protein